MSSETMTLASIGERLEGLLDETFPAFPDSIASSAEHCAFFDLVASRLERATEVEKQAGETKLRLANMEQVLKNLQKKRGEDQEEIGRLKEQVVEATAQISSLQEKQRETVTTRELKGEAERLSEQIITMQAKIDRLEAEKIDLLRSLERRQVEVDELNKLVETGAQRSKELREEILHKDAQLVELQGRLSTINLQLELVREEANRNQQAAEWNATELTQVTNDFATYRKQKSGELASRQSQLEAAQSQVTQLEEYKQRLKQAISEKDERMEELLRRQRDTETRASEQEAMFMQELQAKERLATLYKEALDESTARLEAMEGMLTGTKHDNDQQRRLDELEQSYELELEELRQQLNSKEREVEALQREHSTGDTSMKNSTGAEIYAEYARNKTALVRAEHEIGRLKGCIADICQDIEARVPALQAERRENERLKADVTALTDQLLTLGRAKDSLEMRLREADDRLRQQALLEQQVGDLSKQVQHLLSTMELGGEEAEQQLDTNAALSLTAPNIMDANQVIDERLVVFRNIQELQVRNQELLRVVRELSSQAETAEVDRLKAADGEMRARLGEMARELEELREVRQKQTALVESLIRQRDMLREMQQLGGGAEEETSPHALASPVPEGRSGGESPANVVPVEEYEMFKREKMASERHLHEQLEQTREELLTSRGTLSQLRAQLGFTEERYTLLKQNYEMERRELESLRRSNADALAAIMEHQMQGQRLMTDLLAAKETQQRQLTELSRLRVELETRQATERRLMGELTAVTGEKERLTGLLVGLQSLGRTQDAQETEMKERLARQVESLDMELAACRHRLAEEVESNKLSMARADREYRDLVRRHDQMMESFNKTREEYVQTRIGAAEATKKIADLESLLARNEERLAELMRPASPGDSLDLPRELAAVRAKLASLEDELRLERENVTTYRELARQAEANLMELTRTYDEYRQIMEKHTSELSGAVEALNSQKENLTRQAEEAQEQLVAAEHQQEAALSRHRQEVRELQAQLAQLRQYEEMAQSHQSMRREDADRLQMLLNESQQRLEQEIIAHGRDVEGVSSLREQLGQMEGQVRTLQGQLQTAQERLAEQETTLATERASLTEDRQELERRLADAQQQNNILLTQLEQRLGQQSAMGAVSGGETASPSSGGESLTEVIAYLRRQKDILQVEHDTQTLEYRRIRAQAEQLQRSLDETRALLEEERNANQWQAQMASEYQSLLERVHQLNLLRESNATLRGEAEALERRVAELEGRLSEAQERGRPVEEECARLRAQVDRLGEELKLVRSDREHWRSRHERLLAQYNRVEQESQWEVERERHESEMRELRERAQSTEQQLQEQRAALQEATERVAQWETKHKTLLIQSRQLAMAKSELEKRLQEAAGTSSDKDREERAKLAAERERINAELAAERDKLAGLAAERERLQAQVMEKDGKLEKYAEALKRMAHIREQVRAVREQHQQAQEAKEAAEQRLADCQREAELRANLLTSTWQGKVKRLERELAILRGGSDKQPTHSQGTRDERDGDGGETAAAGEQGEEEEDAEAEAGEEEEEEEAEGDGAEEEEEEEEEAAAAEDAKRLRLQSDRGQGSEPESGHEGGEEMGVSPSAGPLEEEVSDEPVIPGAYPEHEEAEVEDQQRHQEASLLEESPAPPLDPLMGMDDDELMLGAEGEIIGMGEEEDEELRDALSVPTRASISQPAAKVITLRKPSLPPAIPSGHQPPQQQQRRVIDLSEISKRSVPPILPTTTAAGAGGVVKAVHPPSQQPSQPLQRGGKVGGHHRGGRGGGGPSGPVRRMRRGGAAAGGTGPSGGK